MDPTIPPHPPLGLLAKIGRWLVDAAKAPGRIRVLAEDAAADRDKRPVCRSCGAGRIGDTKAISSSGFIGVYGVCDGCGTRWALDRDTGELRHPALDQHHG